jgi:hypothetical protein
MRTILREIIFHSPGLLKKFIISKNQESAVMDFYDFKIVFSDLQEENIDISIENKNGIYGYEAVKKEDVKNYVLKEIERNWEH